MILIDMTHFCFNVDMDETLEEIDDVESFIRDRLPPYVVNCFMAAGYARCYSIHGHK